MQDMELDTGYDTRRRAPKRPLRMPEPIDASPEDIARACMFGPPKREWDYLKTECQRRRD